MFPDPLQQLRRFAKPIPQPREYHDFADQRRLFAITNAADSISNLGFAIVGFLGVLFLLPLGRRVEYAVLICYGAAFCGLLLTAAGSFSYHLQPNNERLAFDRAGLVVVMAAVPACLAAERGAPVLAFILLSTLLGFGWLSVAVWILSEQFRRGDLRLYIAFHVASTFAALALFLLLPDRHGNARSWLFLFGLYGLAKLTELNDRRIFAVTRGFVSGHTLKHILAAIGVGALLNFPR